MGKSLSSKLAEDAKSLMYHEIIKRKEISPFLIFIAFIISFGVARLAAYLFPDLGLIIRDYNIHHFYYGIALLIISNWILLVTRTERLMRIAAVMFGAGLGLITDEIGLLLTCSSNGKICDYYARQSYDFAIIMTLIFMALIYFPPFWEKIKRKIMP